MLNTAKTVAQTAIKVKNFGELAKTEKYVKGIQGFSSAAGDLAIPQKVFAVAVKGSAVRNIGTKAGVAFKSMGDKIAKIEELATKAEEVAAAASKPGFWSTNVGQALIFVGAGSAVTYGLEGGKALVNHFTSDTSRNSLETGYYATSDIDPLAAEKNKIYDEYLEARKELEDESTKAASATKAVEVRGVGPPPSKKFKLY